MFHQITSQPNHLKYLLQSNHHGDVTIDLPNDGFLSVSRDHWCEVTLWHVNKRRSLRLHIQAINSVDSHQMMFFEIHMVTGHKTMDMATRYWSNLRATYKHHCDVSRKFATNKRSLCDHGGFMKSLPFYSHIVTSKNITFQQPWLWLWHHIN